MAHTRFEDLKQRRLGRMTESERDEFEQLCAAESTRLADSTPDETYLAEGGT